MNNSNEIMLKQHIKEKINQNKNNNSPKYITSILTNDEKNFVVENTKNIMPLNMGYTLSQRIHWIYYDLIEFPKCCYEKCSIILSDPIFFQNFDYGYKKGCCPIHSLLSKTTQEKAKLTLIKHLNLIEDDIDISTFTNVFQLPSVQRKKQQSFIKHYGDGITNPGQIINRRKGYDNYLKNIYVQPMFSYEEYNEMCKLIDRYHNKNLKWKCLICGYEFKTNVKSKSCKPDGIHSTGVLCPKCFHYRGSSTFENQIVNFIKSIYNGEIKQCDRTVLKSSLCSNWKGNHEIDIWLPDIKLAIEFNGTYFHSDPRFYNKDFQRIERKITAQDVWNLDKQKYDILINLGIKYLVIWQYDWENNQINCKNIIKNAIINI